MSNPATTNDREEYFFEFLGTFIFLTIGMYVSARYPHSPWAFIAYGVGLYLPARTLGSGFFNFAFILAEGTIGNASGIRIPRQKMKNLLAIGVIATIGASLVVFAVTRVVPIIAVPHGVPVLVAVPGEIIGSFIFGSIFSYVSLDSVTERLGNAKPLIIASTLAIFIAIASATSGGALNQLRAIGPIIAYLLVIVLHVHHNFQHIGYTYIYQLIVVYTLSPSIGVELGYLVVRSCVKPKPSAAAVPSIPQSPAP